MTPEIGTCEHCGKEFKKKRWFQIFCSPECRITHHTQRRAAAYAALAEQEGTERLCPKCGCNHSKSEDGVNLECVSCHHVYTLTLESKDG